MPPDAVTARAWRLGIAFIVAFDAIQLALRTHLRGSLAVSALPVWPALRWIALSAPSLAALAIVGVAGAVTFARGRRQLLGGFVALAAIRLLLEAFGALDGVYDETSYHAGAALAGWLGGRLYARALGEPDDSAEADGMAALGAAAMFGATYLNAGISKVHDSGLSWADGDTIRLLIASHQPVGGTWSDAIRGFVAASPGVARAMSAGTLVVQCGAFLFPWTRWTRAGWGALFVAFHLGIHLVSGIFFIQAVFLACLFALPWPLLLGRGAPVAGAAEAPLPPAQTRRVLLVAAAVVAALAALVIAPLRPRAHPIEVLHPPGGTSSRACAVFGPLAKGMELADGWTVAALVVEQDRLVLTLSRAGQELVFDVHHRGDAPRGPFDTAGLHVHYRQTDLPLEAFRAVGDDVARRLVEAAHGADLASAFDGWLRAARP